MNAQEFPGTLYPWQRAPWQQLRASHRQGRMAHALLLHGRIGSGVSQFADSLNQMLLCEGAAGEAARHLLEANSHPDLLELLPEKMDRPIRVDQVRRVASFLHLASHSGGYRIVRIEPAETMNRHACNALLKVLEEPPAGSLIELICVRHISLPATVLSRCQRINLGAGTEPEVRQWLQGSGVDAERVLHWMQLRHLGPLAARELAQQDGDRVCDSVLRGLCAGTADAGADAVAREWEKLGALESLDWVCALLCALVSCRIGARLPLPESLLQSTAELDLFGLLRFYAMVQQNRKILATQGSGARPLLEELIVQWRLSVRYGRVAKAI